MAFRNVIIESPARISLRNEQLVIHTDADHSIAPEDISALLLESRQSTVTVAALSLLGQRGCAVFVCDEKHMPCAILQPFSQHSRTLSVLRTQLDASEPLKKRLWQAVVREKVRNQGLCLKMVGQEAIAERLFSFLVQIRSGDSSNVEARAAQLYFPALFGRGFVRGVDNGINAGLNYGYAILRGCIARMLAVYGFQPALGIHHRSEVNSFNLADDLIEPFRPMIDLLVYQNIRRDDELTSQHKRLLFNSLNLDVLIGSKHHSVAYAVELAVQSLSSALAAGQAELMLPELQPTKQHRYE